MDIIYKTDPVSKRERPQEKDFNERKRVVRVTPKNDDLRRYLKHPARGKMNAEGSTEWPNDQYTRRRIKEGDVTVEESGGEPKTIEASGAKSAAQRTDKPAPASETTATTDPNKTTAPKTA